MSVLNDLGLGQYELFVVKTKSKSRAIYDLTAGIRFEEAPLGGLVITAEQDAKLDTDSLILQHCLSRADVSMVVSPDDPGSPRVFVTKNVSVKERLGGSVSLSWKAGTFKGQLRCAVKHDVKGALPDRLSMGQCFQLPGWLFGGVDDSNS